MTNFDRNTRTLIVSFLVAIFALIPLRFVEVGQEYQLGQAQVLGETIEAPAEKTEVKAEAKLEEPYKEIESCIDQIKIEELRSQLEAAEAKMCR